MLDKLTDEERKLFMSEEEIERRLTAGEDPIDLSIEAWERKRDAITKIDDTYKIPMRIEDCPLCLMFYEACYDEDEGCSECPLAKNGYHCLDDESPYWIALTTFQHEKCPDSSELYTEGEKILAAENMINALKEVKQVGLRQDQFDD